ncbi:APC family permease [Vibrio marisflavi]|uniref:Glutamate/gamma-aminobutyrate antiporter n=1 Tax=Vibrio marisflavi CECT 7928 TaxID=634439 RepID=A0ABN8E1T1_9VIBR|nr:APC family permease [Vibrio marisflavi]CAH0538981.1 Glutamate/gamma-aminobutyrate antiporter [Vibrio marisflavi CECT 7928]
MITNRKNKKALSVFSLVMINVIAVDSLRSLPISAEYGLSLIFYYIAGAIFFMIPSALAAADMSTGWPQDGGIYVWVREAFGKKAAFVVAWILWLYNIIWFPTILSFLASTFFYIVDPSLATDKTMIFVAITIMFWLATLANCFGMRVSGLISTLGSIFGTILPMLLIIILAAGWVMAGKHVAINFSWNDALPDMSNLNNLAILSGMLFGLVGMEMSAIHAQDVENPKKDYPRALLYSTVLILFCSVLGSLAVAIVIPQDQINLSSAVITSFSIFFASYKMSWMMPIIMVCIILGGFSGVSAWILGPGKCIRQASEDGSAPKFLAKSSKNGAPIAILMVQGIIFTGLAMLFLYFPGFNASYWLLSAMTAQLSVIFYLFLFAALIKLKVSQPDVPRGYSIPGGVIGTSIVGGIGIITCLFVLAMGFLPPSQITIMSKTAYEAILIGGTVLVCVIPLLIPSATSKAKKQQVASNS